MSSLNKVMVEDDKEGEKTDIQRALRSHIILSIVSVRQRCFDKNRTPRLLIKTGIGKRTLQIYRGFSSFSGSFCVLLGTFKLSNIIISVTMKLSTTNSNKLIL